MSENHQDPALPGSPEPDVVSNFHDEPDWLLIRLVSMANDGFSIGLILLVDGAIVSGDLIGGAQYLTLFGESFASGLSSADKTDQDNIRAFYTEEGTRIYTKPSEGDTMPSPTFVHLKEARYYSSSTSAPIPQEGSLWRGRLTKVSGFMLGSFSYSEKR